MRAALIVFLTALFCSVGRALAEAEEPLQVEAVLASLRTHHPLIAAEWRAVAAAESEVQAARGEFDPQLSVQGRWAAAGYYDPRRFDALIEQPTPWWGASVYAGYRIGRGNIAPYYGEQRTLSLGEVRGGVRVPLLQDRALDARRAGIATSQLQREASEHEFDRVRLQLAREATLAYYTWLGAGKRLHVAEALSTLAEQREAQVNDKVALGALPRVEAVDQHRTVAERKRQLVQARRAFEKAAYELSLFLRDAAGQPRVASASELPKELKAESGPVPELERSVASALSRRPEVRWSETQREVARVERALAGTRVYPRLDVFGEVSRDFGRGQDEWSRTLAPTVVEAGATFSLPLGLRKARGKLRAAEAKLDALEHKLQFTRDKVRADVLDAFSQLRAAAERTVWASEAAEAAEQVARGERERFELGASTVLFVNLREQAAADAQIALVDAHVERELALWRARLSAGEQLVD